MHAINHETVSSEYAAAFGTTKRWKNLFAVIVLLAILLQLTSFILIYAVGVVDSLHAETDTATTIPTQATQRQNDIGEIGTANWWDSIFSVGLGASKFFGFVAAVLMALAIMFAVKISLLDRLGGVSGFVSAFFWSVLLVAILTPWQQILQGSLVSGALGNYPALLNSMQDMCWNGDDEAGLFDWTIFWLKFVAYPAVALLIWLIVLLKFRRGYRDSDLSTTVGRREPTPAEEPDEMRRPSVG
ncbi:MAG: hypothetical protein ACLFVU_06030 [Phycisphaerae bacterium]